MGMDGYPKDLLGFIKPTNNYITESGNNTTFRNTPGREHTGSAFTQSKEKDKKYKKKTNIKGEYHCLHYGKKYHWAADCTNIEEQQRGQLHTNGEEYTTGVSFFEKHQNTKTRNITPKKDLFGNLFHI